MSNTYLIHDQVACVYLLVRASDESDAYRSAAENEGWEDAVTNPSVRICLEAWVSTGAGEAEAKRQLLDAMGRDASEGDRDAVWEHVVYDPNMGNVGAYYVPSLVDAIEKAVA